MLRLRHLRAKAALFRLSSLRQCAQPAKFAPSRSRREPTLTSHSYDSKPLTIPLIELLWSISPRIERYGEAAISSPGQKRPQNDQCQLFRPAIEFAELQSARLGRRPLRCVR